MAYFKMDWNVSFGRWKSRCKTNTQAFSSPDPGELSNDSLGPGGKRK